MVRDNRVKMKLNRRRKDITKKKTRVPCNFCEFSSSRYGFGSSEQSLQDQDNEEAVLQKQVVRLRSLIKRMTGRDDDASFTELQALQSRLEDVKPIVTAKLLKMHEDKSKQKNKAEDDGTSIPVPCISSTSREEKQLMKIEREFERRKSESLQSEFERLWILNERMNGRDIESMSCFGDVIYLHSQITYAVMSLSEQMTRPRQEQLCKAERAKSVVKINADKLAMPIADEKKELRRSVRLAKKRNEEKVSHY